MEAPPFYRFIYLSIKKRLLPLLLLSSLVGASGVIATSKNTQDKAKNTSKETSSLERAEILESSPANELIPMPTGQIDIALTKVERTRDPFQEAPVTESSNIDLLRSAIEFNGIAKSGETLVAIIKTEEGQKFYKIGDRLDNGFIIEKISETDLTADISNGIKSYRLSIERFRD